jgi:hypothetical protein
MSEFFKTWGEAGLESLCSLSVDRLLDDDLRHESVVGCAHRGELGVIAAQPLHREQLKVDFVT